MGDYTPAFESLWQAYPKRSNGNPKLLAWKAYKARLAEGIDPALLLACTVSYAQAMRRAGKVGTDYVLQGATFFGPNERWRDFIPPPAAPVVARTAPSRVVEERIDPEAGKRFIRELLASLRGGVKAMP